MPRTGHNPVGQEIRSKIHLWIKIWFWILEPSAKHIFVNITLTSFQKRTFPHQWNQHRCDQNVTSSLGPSSPIPQSQFELPNAPGVQLTSESCVEEGRCSLSLDLSTPLLACMCSVGQTNKLPPRTTSEQLVPSSAPVTTPAILQSAGMQPRRSPCDPQCIGRRAMSEGHHASPQY